MPNWCISTVSIHSNKKEIELLWNKLQEATSANPEGADFGNMWLGNLVLHVGKKWEDVDCRGAISWMNKTSDNIIDIDVESAWSPQLEPIKLMAEKYAPNASVYYTAEEPGCELYYTNDPDMVGKYIVGTWMHWSCSQNISGNDDEKLACFEEREPITEGELREALIEVLGIADGNYTIRELIHMFTEKYEGAYVYQYEYVEI